MDLKKIALVLVIILVVAIIYVLGGNQMKDGEKVTIKGKYGESKAGPVVVTSSGPVVLIDKQFESGYNGKNVEAKGTIYYNHEFKCKPVKKGEPVSQCFDMPILKNVTSLKIN